MTTVDHILYSSTASNFSVLTVSISKTRNLHTCNKQNELCLRQLFLWPNNTQQEIIYVTVIFLNTFVTPVLVFRTAKTVSLGIMYSIRTIGSLLKGGRIWYKQSSSHYLEKLSTLLWPVFNVKNRQNYNKIVGLVTKYTIIKALYPVTICNGSGFVY